MYTKLKIFDFDGTLIDTPKPTYFTKNEYAKYHGLEEWPFLGWYGRPETLDMSVWDMNTIPQTISDYNKVMGDPNTLTIMLTGRVKKLKPQVISILDKHGLKFDDYLFNKGGETSLDKMKQIEGLLKEYPTINDVEMWDDRDEHIPTFQKWGKTLKPIKFKINHVKYDG